MRICEMSKPSWLLGVMLSLASIEPCQADYLDWQLQVTCDADSGRAEIVPYAVYNEDVYSAEAQDCMISSGRTVRAKMDVGPAYPYGEGA